MSTSERPFRTSPSSIARYFFHDCQRFLRFSAARSERRRAEGIPDQQFDHSPLVKAILESGHAWEAEVLDKYLLDRVLIAPGEGELHTRRFDWDRTVDLLRTAEPGTFIYQPTLRLPRRFYEQYGLDPALVTISDNHPDLIAVLDGGEGGRLLRVLDLKRGDSLHLTHRVQILLYALELDSLLPAAGIGDARADVARGAVWLGFQPASTEFELTDFRPHLENFLRHDLMRVLRASATDAQWHVHFRCEWCEFFKHCWNEMQQGNDLSRVTHLTTHGKQYLREKARVRNVGELSDFLKQPTADETLSRCASLAGGRPRLEQQVAALEDGQPHPHGAASPSLSKGENVSLFLTLQQEPLGQSIYLAGIYVTVREDLRKVVFSNEVAEKLFDGKKSQPYVRVAPSPDDVPDIRREWIHLLHEILTQVDRYNEGREWRDQLSLQPYVFTEQEKSLLVTWLLDSLQDPELASEAMTLLFHFQGPDLMVADQHPDAEVPFPVVVLLDALGHVLALPVEVSYTLPEALAALGSKFKYRRNDYFHFPLGHGMRAEAIHAAWNRGKPELLPEIEKQAAMHLRAVWALLQAIRSKAEQAIFAWTAKFSLPDQLPFDDPLLSRLAFFARYESLLRCLETRHDRCEPRAVQTLLGQVMELRVRDETQLEVIGNGAMQIDAGGFPEWLLVSDSEAGRRAQLEYRDYACRKQLWLGKKQADLAVVGISQVERDAFGAPVSLTVQYHKPFDDGPQAGQRLLLYPRFTDFTTDRVIEFLRQYDPAREGELFLRLLRDPAEAAAPLPLPDDVEGIAAEQEEQLRLTPSQAAAYRQIRQLRVVPVWGPPGTGKTHFLASVVVALAEAHARAGRPFRVLVSAFTHAAIENLLRKIVELSEQYSTTSALSTLAIGKVKVWQGGGAARGEVVEEGDLTRWLDSHPQSVVGATVYSSLKQYDHLEPFDLVVIDEASQVRVPESVVPISLVAKHGRVVLAGDHRQLPPIIVGVYPETREGEPIVHRSIFEAVATEAAPVQQLLENFRMNDVLTSFAAELLYGPNYHSVNDEIACRRLALRDERCLDPFVEACLAPEFPLVVVVLDGVWAARENPQEAQLVAKLVTALRENLRTADGSLHTDDEAFFRDGVFIISPHRAQIRQIERELRRLRMWQYPPFVDTVDKMQGQETDAVIVSYGVSDPEFAMQEAEFIYSLNRLNVAITRARAKSIVCLPRPLLDASPQVLDQPEASRGLSFMRALVEAVGESGDALPFDLGEGLRAVVYRARDCLAPPQKAKKAEHAETLDEFIPDDIAPAKAAEGDKAGPLRRKRPAAGEPVEVEVPRGKRRKGPANEGAVGRGSPAVGRGSPDPAPRAQIPLGKRDQLNPQQREAACHGHDPLLIVAGAGTGKTTTLVHRVAHLISEGVPPQRILLLTFTRRAANEMLRRVAATVVGLVGRGSPDPARLVWGGTFHSIASRLLRTYGSAIGVDPRFSIHDRGDSEDLLQAICTELELGKGDKKFPKKGTCMAIHSYAVNSGQPLADVLESQFASCQAYADPLRTLFAKFEQRKRELSVFDYDDLLVKWCELLEHPEAGERIRGRFDCVLVDEYQDTNHLQSVLLKRLRPDGRGLTVVGDDAQSIYSFRAATVRNILDFPRQFPGSRVIALEQNYRSTPPILEASNRVIAQAQERFTKDLWSERPAGPRPQLVTCDDEYDQVEFIVGRILQHRELGIPLRQQAVLFRAAHHSILLEAALARHDLPFEKYGGLKFVESAHAKDLLSLLRLAENPRDPVAAGRALGLLPGIGPAKAGQLHRQLAESGGQFGIWDSAKPPAKAQSLWPNFLALMKRLADGGDDLSRQVNAALQFYQPLLEEQYDNHAQRLADLEQLEQLAGTFPDRATMLADLTVDPPTSTADLPRGQRDEDVLVLSTIHSAKGLEWQAVYVLHASDGKIPLERAAADPEQLEEERRLFYVALTRAADWLYVCHPRHESQPGYGRGWESNFAGTTRLTRFIDQSAKQSFQRQQAAQFEPPAATSSGPKKKKPRKATRTA